MRDIHELGDRVAQYVTPFGSIADDWWQTKYKHETIDRGWHDVAARVAYNVMGSVGADPEPYAKAIAQRKFMTGGRYFYAAGRPLHQVQNCLLMRAEDSREGWSDLLHKSAMALMTGAGIGVVYSNIRHEGAKIRRTGGLATGPVSLARILNEAGRGIQQGGSRRSAIWGGLHWWHPDALKWIEGKNWSDEIRALKAKDFNFPAPLDGTNISIILDDAFFYVLDHPHEQVRLDLPGSYYDGCFVGATQALQVYHATVRQMLKTAEPGFSVDVGVNAGECLRNAPVAACTNVLTTEGYQSVGSLVDRTVVVWTGRQWAKTRFKKTKSNTPTVRVKFTGERSIVCDPDHEFLIREYDGRGSRRKCRIVRVAAKHLQEGDYLEVRLPTPDHSLDGDTFCRSSYTAGFRQGDGHKNELTLCGAKVECAEFFEHSSITHVGRNGEHPRYYFDGPNDIRHTESFLAGWFDADGSVDLDQHRIRLSGERSEMVEARRLLETIGVSSTLSKRLKSGYVGFEGEDTRNLIVLGSSIERFVEVVPCKRLDLHPLFDYEPYRRSELQVLTVEADSPQDVFCCDVGVEEHSFQAEGVIISNCTEITSRDDSDICNLGSIVLSRVEDLAEMRYLTKLGTELLLAGTVYSDVPYAKVDRVREKNRRLGLGMMGVAEWLYMNGFKYEPNDELERYLLEYARSTDYAHEAADRWGITRPIKTRAMAPNGTIGGVAETTTCIEPILAVAQKRRYMKAQAWVHQFTVDPTAKRLIERGIDPNDIEDAYTLAQDVERRVAFQAWFQKFVDHGISSTINLPAWGSEFNNESTVQSFSDMLLKYLPKLRGITCYPDGARGGQPITAVSYEEAIAKGGEIRQEDICDLTKAGTCGD